LESVPTTSFKIDYLLFIEYCLLKNFDSFFNKQL